MVLHPFRFGLHVQSLPAAGWRERARHIEALGFSTLLVPDHFGPQWDPTALMAATASVTETLRVGALVHDVDYRHPVVHAKQAATLQLLSGGRHEFGLGAIATHSFDEAIDRANAALEVGADAAFVEAMTTLDEVAAVRSRVRGPCVLNVVPGGRTPIRDLDQAEEMGYRIAICPGLLLGATVAVGDRVLKELRETRRHPSSGRGSVGSFFDRFGAADWDAIRSTES